MFASLARTEHMITLTKDKWKHARTHQSAALCQFILSLYIFLDFRENQRKTDQKNIYI